MRYQPTGDQLLDTARTLLRDELIPALPPEKRHVALMIANAMAIATRQLQAGEAPQQREVAELRRMLSAEAGDDTAEGVSARTQLAPLNRRLCERIRVGHADSGPFHDAVWQHLRAVVRQEVAESNPKYLAGGAA